MEKLFLFWTLIVVAIAIFMYYMEYNISIISGVGGIIASSFWMYYIISTGLPNKTFEFLSAFAWFVFSVLVIIVQYYE